MNYTLINDVMKLVEDFDSSVQDGATYSGDIEGFKHWLMDKDGGDSNSMRTIEWEGKSTGRSPESVISTLIVHMNRYAKSYSRAAIYGSEFSTQEDFIYLINLRAFGALTKMELIKKNVHDKPTGMQIINRLIDRGWVVQSDSDADKRSKIIAITDEGTKALEARMDKIRLASEIVTGDLTYREKMELIRLLTKLDHYHQPIFMDNISPALLLDSVKLSKQ